MESPKSANYAAATPLEEGVATDSSSSNNANTQQHTRKKRMLLIGVFVVVIIAAAVAVAVVVATQSSSSSSPNNDNNNTISKDPAANKQGICDVTVQQDAGYITLPNKKDGHYFYWYFESRSKPQTDPLVLWLTGGPGCSSLWAMLAENGPCTIEKDLTTKNNPYSWNTNANVIWLDQPMFTGYSYSENSKDFDSGAANVQENLYLFLQGFLDKHPALRERELYITGESYAGHYIPPSAHYIWTKNQELLRQSEATNKKKINLKGIAIGNGITASAIQYEHYLDMANNSYGISLSSSATLLQAGQSNAQECAQMIDDCQDKDQENACENALDFCWYEMESALDFQDRNPYDIRMPCSEPNSVDCYKTPEIGQFLNSDKIQAYLGIPQDKVPAWRECNSQVSSPFVASGDYVANHQKYIATLLDQSDIRVLIYAGDADTVCNWVGNYAWTKQLDWTHKKEFNDAKERAFVTNDGKKAGVLRSYLTQFTFLRVFESGHMVPMDQPQAALEMLQRFMADTTL